MKCNRFRRVACGAAILAGALVLLNGTPVSAATLKGDKGLAGISVSMDKYYDKLASKQNKIEKAEAEAQSELADIGISLADPYVNIRTAPSTDSEIVGKLYEGSAATILEHVGEWVKIQSGNAEGYINADFLAIGFDAEEVVDKYAWRWAYVNVDGLRIRMEPSLEAKIATVVPKGEKLLVTSIVDDEWMEISIDDGDITGFVYSEYVDIEIEFKHAITIEEEQAEIRRQREAEEALRKRRAEQAERERKATEEAKKAAKEASEKLKETDYSDEELSELAVEIVTFAQKFVGNKYVWGGTSLTNGCDCSGFVQSVFSNFGISIERTSRSQCATNGYAVSLDSAKPGDLVFYTNSSGVVSHVAMYIGNGKIVHASDPKSGIIISNMMYRTPYKVKRIIE